MKNKFYFMLLSVFLSVSYLSAQVVQSVNVPTAGGLATSIGSNLKTVTDLTLTGTINATDFQTIKQMTALKNLDMSKVDVVEKAIPANAFRGRVLNNLILPQGLETIGSSAFRELKLINSLVLSPSLKTLSYESFCYMTVPSIDLSQCSDLENIGADSFFGLNLTATNTIDLSEKEKLINFASGSFNKFSGHVILPQTMTALPAGTFFGFVGSVDLPEGLITLGANSFRQSSPSKAIILPKKLETIGSSAFRESKLISSLVLPPSLKTLSYESFCYMTVPSIDLSQCSDLENIGADSFFGLNLTATNTIDLSEKEKLINFASGSFNKFSGHVILPQTMTALPAGTFFGFVGSVDLPEGLITLGANSFRQSSPSKAIILPKKLETIGSSAFRESKLISSLVLPPSLKTLSYESFCYMTVPSIDLSQCSDLENIGADSFFGLNLTATNTIDLSEKEKLINFASGSFNKFSGHVILPQTMTVLPAGTFLGFVGSVDLPEGLITLGANSFRQSSPSKAIILPKKLETIGSSAFRESKLISSLVLPPSLKTLSYESFCYMTVPSIDLSQCSDLENIGADSFFGLNLTATNTIDLSEKEKLINFASGSFNKFSGHVILPQTMTALPAGTFFGFVGSVDLSPVLKTIGSSAFQNSSIKEIELPASVTSIGSNAFYNCTILQKITSCNATPPALGTNVFYGVNKTTCGLFVPAGGIPLYEAAAQWKDFMIGTYTFDMRLADTNLYRVSNEEPFTIKMPAYMALSVNLGLYTLNGTFLESINKSNERGIVTCQISDNIANGNYLIQPYTLDGDEKKIVSRISGSHNIDRLPITVENDWWSTRAVKSTNATADISSHLQFKTGASNLLEVTPNQNFNIQVRYKNATTAIKIGLYDALTGTMVADVTQSVTGNNYTCKVPASVLPGEYNLIPYELASGKPVFVERGEDLPYIIDRLPLSVISATNVTKALVVDEITDQVNVSVYPNPATDVIYVAGTNVEQLSIYDMSGHKVLTSSGSTSLVVGNLSKGTYLLRVKTTDGESTHKIIKK